MGGGELRGRSRRREGGRGRLLPPASLVSDRLPEGRSQRTDGEGVVGSQEAGGGGGGGMYSCL